MKKSLISTLAAFLSLLVVLIIPSTVLADYNDFSGGGKPTVLSPTTRQYGLTYAEWSNTWWQWAYAIPASKNPVKDTTGQYCDVGQLGPVWFLGGSLDGTPVNRSCTIPRGVALFFPLTNFESDNIGVVPPLSVKGLRDSLKPLFTYDPTQPDLYLDPNTFGATIDGVSVPNLSKYKVGPNDAQAFSFFLPKNNVYYMPNTPSGLYYPVVNAGYYLMVSPLSKGTHTIAFHAGNALSTQNVSYTLTVK